METQRQGVREGERDSQRKAKQKCDTREEREYLISLLPRTVTLTSSAAEAKIRHEGPVLLLHTLQRKELSLLDAVDILYHRTVYSYLVLNYVPLVLQAHVQSKETRGKTRDGVYFASISSMWATNDGVRGLRPLAASSTPMA